MKLVVALVHLMLVLAAKGREKLQKFDTETLRTLFHACGFMHAFKNPLNHPRHCQWLLATLLRSTWHVVMLRGKP